MKIIRNILLTAALVTTGIFMSCGGDGGGGPKLTDGEKVIDALVSSSWSIDATASNVDAEGSPDVATFGVSFSETATGISFTLSGDIADYLSGGAFDVSEEGAVSNVSLNTASSDISITTQNVNIASDYSSVTVTATVTAANARGDGVGTYTVVFTAAS